ncbi:hypothetical protein IFM89_012587 [Coptis chinensis]|uniref:TFIIS N-terminal domain-containing protein n=1 Tax=Coptis chinensis TaxID=261450 RepID=A0A835H5U8_9MAGN|nr:hypothetical protein IFM89_012587 [Coptis chinensis]
MGGSMQSGNIESWRKYFKSANADIFDVIEQAILVAATDCPNEFKIRRDRIAEKLFTCRLPRCFGCDGVGELLPGVVVEEGEGEGEGDDDDVKGNLDVEEKENKGNCSTNVYSDLNENKVSNYSYHEAEALTEMLEEENQTIDEVDRIKAILENSEDVTTSALLDSLTRLQLMDITVQTLLSTDIGKAVSAFRKHHIKEISRLSRSLVSAWKSLISEWVVATEASKDSNDSPDSVKPAVMDEEEYGLPSPPLDEGLFFAPEANSMELSKFFDGIDEDGNLDSGRNANANGRKPMLDRRTIKNENRNVQKRESSFHREENILPKDDKNRSMVKHENSIKQTKPSNNDSRFQKPSKLGLEAKPNNEVKLQKQLDTVRTQRKPVSDQSDKSNSPGLVLDQKLELSKRKLHQGYQQAENAKKQRTIQVMELHDLPKQSFGSNNKNSHARPGSHNRQWLNGRR